MANIKQLLNTLTKATVTVPKTKQKPRSRPSRKSHKNTFTLDGQDLVTFLPNEVVGDENQIFAVIPSNPCYWRGTRVSQIAAAYQAFNINRISFEYVPQVSVGYNGTVIAGTLWDAAPASQALQQTLATSPGGRMQVCYRRFVTNIPLAGLQQRRFNTNGEMAQSTNPFTFVATIRGGNLAFQEPSPTQVVPGYFRVKYSFNFYNPIGSGWDYGVVYNTTISEMPSIAAQNMSLINLTSFGTFGAGTIFDYEAGDLVFRGTKLEIPSVKFNLYYNGTKIANGFDQLGIAPKLDTITGIQVNYDINDPDSPWEDLFPYTISTLEAIPRGVPGKVTIRLLEALPSDLRPEGNLAYRWYLQAWYGISDWQLNLNSFRPSYMFETALTPTQTVWIRCKTELGRHSTPIVVGQSIFDIASAFDKQNPATVSLNYLGADIEFRDPDGQPITPEPWSEDNPSLSRPQGIPPKWGPRISDLDADFYDQPDWQDTLIGMPVGPNDLLFWTSYQDVLKYVGTYAFRITGLAEIQDTRYRGYRLCVIRDFFAHEQGDDEPISPWPLNEWFYVLNEHFVDDRTLVRLNYKGPSFTDVYPTPADGDEAFVIGEQNDTTPAVFKLTYTKSPITDSSKTFYDYSPSTMRFGARTAGSVSANSWYTDEPAWISDDGTQDSGAYAVPTANPIFDLFYEGTDYQLSKNLLLEDTPYNFVIGFTPGQQPTIYLPDNSLDQNNGAVQYHP